MHSKSNNAEIMMGIERNDVINELFYSSLQKYQDGSETKKRGSDLFLKVLIYCAIVFIK